MWAYSKLFGRITRKKYSDTRQAGAVCYKLTECPALNMLLLSYSTTGGPGRLRHGTPIHTKQYYPIYWKIVSEWDFVFASATIPFIIENAFWVFPFTHHQPNPTKLIQNKECVQGTVFKTFVKSFNCKN